MSDLKVLGLWLINFRVDPGGFLLYANLDLLTPRAFYLYFSVLEENIIRNIKMNGSMMLPCLTPTLKLMDASIFSMISLTKLFSYMLLIA